MNYWDTDLKYALEAIRELAKAAIILVHNEDQRRQEKHEAEKRRGL